MLEKLDVNVLIIGPEKSKAFKKYWEKNDMPFVGLPDPGHSVMKLYGQQVKLLKLGRMPAQMLIDKSGVLKFIYYGSSMRDIPDPGELKKIVQELS